MVPSEDPEQRLAQMGTLASALTALGIKYSDDLTYVPGMAPRSANRSKLEKGGMQVQEKKKKTNLSPLFCSITLLYKVIQHFFFFFVQVLSKEDLETLELCRAMYRRGECPPLVVVFDPLEGYHSIKSSFNDIVGVINIVFFLLSPCNTVTQLKQMVLLRT